MEMGSSSRRGSDPSETLNGLSFGEKIYFEGSKSSSSPSSSPAPPQRKGKAAAGGGGGGQRPRCQVEGCDVDLTGAKAYYCRHKVCGVHSKSPKVVVAGIEQRFCQQCSSGRFGGILVDFTHQRPQGTTARGTWPTIRGGDQIPGNQSPTNERFGAPPWAYDHYIQVSIAQRGHPYPSPGIPPGPPECLTGVADSSCALSLLSTAQTWNNNTNTNTISTNNATRNEGLVFGHPNMNDFSDNNGGGAGARLHLMDLGQDVPEPVDAQFSGELELALQGGRQCHLMNWSL
ncbi:Squamosa promoter-binding-like protein 14 [Acorus gramineus]|uniref:Squamosa promoter-binding-like protein 14 n=1 Tax=Acorus gramineus TaxID=55184 RepID=A0AAV9A586_ACOGR|nr:Squamosa promoter-binding-like protein 14 [Acorus gramineus]